MVEENEDEEEKIQRPKSKGVQMSQFDWKGEDEARKIEDRD